MQLYPLTPEPVDAEAPSPHVHNIVSHPTPAPVDSIALDSPRTFCVVFLKDARGPLWKVDVVADDAISAARSVAYREQIQHELITGVIDLATIR